jgi:hypothetical protein
VARGYLELADRVEGVIRVEARGSIEEVGARVREVLGRRFPETFGDAGVTD